MYEKSPLQLSAGEVTQLIKRIKMIMLLKTNVCSIELVSVPLDPSKRLRFHSLADLFIPAPTNSTSLGSIQPVAIAAQI